MLNMKEQEYENRIPPGKYSSKANTRQPMAGAGVRDGIWKAGTNTTNNVQGMRKRMESARKN